MVLNYKIIQPGYFNVAVTALMPSYVDALITGMVKKGYTVSPALAGGSLSMTHPNSAAALIVFTVYTGSQDATTKSVMDHLMQIIKEQNLSIYSSIVTEYANAMFMGSNISLPEKQETPPLPPVPPETMRKMN